MKTYDLTIHLVDGDNVKMTVDMPAGTPFRKVVEQYAHRVNNPASALYHVDEECDPPAGLIVPQHAIVAIEITPAPVEGIDDPAGPLYPTAQPIPAPAPAQPAPADPTAPVPASAQTVPAGADQVTPGT